MPTLCSPLGLGKYNFFPGRQCVERGDRVLLGDERGSVIVGRDGHVELGFRNDHFCGMLNLKSDYVLSV